MKLKDEIVELVNKRYEELLRMFSDADSIPIDVLELKRLRDELYPLLEDIKTEVSDIQRQVHQEPKDSPKKRKKRKPYEPDEPDPEMDKHLQELLKDLDGADKLYRKLEKYILTLPPGDHPWLDIGPEDILPNIAAIWFVLKETIGKLVDSIVQGNANKLERTLWESFINNETTKIINRVEDAENQIMIYLDRQIETLLDQLSRCCSEMQRMLGDNTNTLDRIERVVNQLDPAAQANQDLAVEARVRAVQSELAAIRGLL